MSLYKKIHLDSSNGNIIVEKIAENGCLVVNTIDYSEFVAQYTRDLKERIEELQKLLERSEVCFNHQCNEQAEEIERLKEQLANKESQLEGFIQQYQEKDLSSLGENYRQAFDLFVAGEVEKALLLLDEEVLGEAEKSQAENRLLKGQILLSVDRIEEAEANYKRAVSIYPSAENYESLGDFYKNIRLYKKALTCYRKAKNLGNNDLNTFVQWTHIGSCYDSMDDYLRANQYYQKAWKMLVKLQTLPYQNALDLICGMAIVAYRLGDYETAEEKYRDAIKVQRDALAVEETDFPYERLAHTLCALAKMLSDLKDRAKEVEPLFVESIAIWEAHLQDNPELFYPQYADTLLYYANFLSKRDPVAAEDYYLKALNVFRSQVLKYRMIFKPVLSQILLSLSLLYSDMGRDADTICFLKESAEIMETLVPGNPDFYLYKLCYIYFQLGMLNKEEEVMEKYFLQCLGVVCKMSEKQRAKCFGWEAMANYDLGILYCKKDFNKAFSYFDESIRIQRLQIAEAPENKKEQKTLAEILEAVGNFYSSIEKEPGWDYLQESVWLYQSLGLHDEASKVSYDLESFEERGSFGQSPFNDVTVDLKI